MALAGEDPPLQHLGPALPIRDAVLSAKCELLVRQFGDPGHLATELVEEAGEPEGEGPIVGMPERLGFGDGLAGKEACFVGIARHPEPPAGVRRHSRALVAAGPGGGMARRPQGSVQVTARRSELPDVEEGLAERGVSRGQRGRIAGLLGAGQQFRGQLVGGAKLSLNEADIPQSPQSPNHLRSPTEAP